MSDGESVGNDLFRLRRVMVMERIGVYNGIKRQMAILDAAAAEARASVIELLAADGAPAGHKWEYEGVGRVTVVKGRETEKILRRALIARGVDPLTVDEATEVTVGRPTVRISPWGDDGD